MFTQIENAKATEQKIDEELKGLQATLANIENVRPFDELSVSMPYVQFVFCYSDLLQVSDIGEAHPEITKAVETMISKGKWTVPGSSFNLFAHLSHWLNYFLYCRIQGEVRRPVSHVITVVPA